MDWCYFSLPHPGEIGNVKTKSTGKILTNSFDFPFPPSGLLYYVGRGGDTLVLLIRAVFLSVTVFVFAATLMALLLNLQVLTMSFGKRLCFFGGMILIVLCNLVLSARMGAECYGKYYTLLAQLPVFALFWGVSGRGFAAVFFATLTAIFLTFPLVLANVAITRLFRPTIVGTVLISLLVCAVFVLFVYHFLRPNFIYMLNHSKQGILLKFCMIPFIYNLIGFAIGKYNFSASMPINTLPICILLFLMTLAAYFLLLDIFKNTGEKERLQGEQELLSSQLKAARQRMEELKHSQEQSRYYRHDIRHHLALINGYLTEGNTLQLQKYLEEVQQDIEAITPVRFCENETVNLILSSFKAKAEERGVRLLVVLKLPEVLPLSDTELCAVLSNGLENAIFAASRADCEDKMVHLECKMSGHKLLIQMENPYADEVIMEDGLPQSRRAGHGLGVKSMVSIVNRREGLYSFQAQCGTFILRMVL